MITRDVAEGFYRGPDEAALVALLAEAACPLPCAGAHGSPGWHAECEERARAALAVLRPPAARSHEPLTSGTADEHLPWTLVRRRCRAVRHRGPLVLAEDAGRCELRAGHDGDHALSRWQRVVRFRSGAASA